MKKLFYVVFTFVIFVTSQQESFAQLFSKAKLPEKLNSKQEEILAKIYKHSDTKSVNFVSIKSPKKLSLRNRQIEFSFEEKGIKKVVVDVKRLEFQENGDYVWFGQALLKDQENFVQVLLIKKDEDVFGLLEYNEKTFHIYGLGDELSVMVELQAPLTSNNGDVCTPIIPNKLAGNGNNNGGNTPETINPCSGFGINIIVFFTPVASSNVPNMSQFARTCVETYNTALVGNYSNSAANNANNFLVLKGAEILPGFLATNFNIQNDLNNFNNDPVANARQLIPAISADIKVLISDANYGNTRGIAFLGAEVGSSSAVVLRTAAFGFGGTHTFAHEVGHLLGAHHDLDDELNPTPGFASGFNHATFADVNFGWFGQRKRRFGTALFSPFNFNGTNIGSSRLWENILNFSSPMQSVSGAVLGDANCCDNTRTILENSARVRGLTTESKLTVGLFGEYWITQYTPTPCIFEPIINCGKAPFTSEWTLFIDGVFIRTETLSNDTPFSLFSSPLDIVGEGSSVEIFLKVTDANGQIANTYRNLYVYYSQSDLVDPNKNSLKEESSYVELIYPNPVSDKFVFEYKLEVFTNIDISIFSSNGELVQNRKVESGVGHFSQKFDVSNMPAGMYLLRALINEKIVIQKFSIVR